MRIAHENRIDYARVSGHRTGDIQFKRLLQGDPAAFDNYELSLVRNRGDYYTPRHRHNFDQMRLVIEGEFGYATRKSMKQGVAGFFPEGTYYGPQTVKDCVTLILQCGAPSASGFLDYDSLHQGHLEMQKLGKFESGVFHRNVGTNQAAGRRKQDSYEAIWEFKRGKRVSYPKARYSEPVIMDPAAFAWQPTEESGAARKLLGHFVANTRMEMLSIQPNASLHLETPRAIQLLYVTRGAGKAVVATDGQTSDIGKPWGPGSAIEIAPGESVRLSADETAEIFLMGFAEIAAAAAPARAHRAAA